MEKIKVKFIRKIDGWKGDARLYKLSEPVEYGWKENPNAKKETTEYVIISAVSSIMGPETYIFPANEDRETMEMIEMAGSFQGGLNHAEAVFEAGWDIL